MKSPAPSRINAWSTSPAPKVASSWSTALRPPMRSSVLPSPGHQPVRPAGGCTQICAATKLATAQRLISTNATHRDALSRGLWCCMACSFPPQGQQKRGMGHYHKKMPPTLEKTQQAREATNGGSITSGCRVPMSHRWRRGRAPEVRWRNCRRELLPGQQKYEAPPLHCTTEFRLPQNLSSFSHLS